MEYIICIITGVFYAALETVRSGLGICFIAYFGPKGSSSGPHLPSQITAHLTISEQLFDQLFQLKYKIYFTR